MKKIILFLGILLACYGAFAQTLNVQGTVHNNGTGIAFNPVILHIYSGGSYIGQDSTHTDSAGFYIFAYPLSPTINFGVIIVETPDCQGGWLVDSTSFSTGNMNFVMDFSYCAGGAACQSSFYVTSTGSGIFSFFDQSFSSSGVTSWSWDFGDGNVSTTQNSTHTYNAFGNYVVCLTISDATGCADTQCQTITYGSSGCYAQFSSFDMGGGQFLLNADTSLSTASDYYWWDFGDGSPFTDGPTVTHTFSANGVYYVCLTVLDSVMGCNNTYCDTVVVGNQGGGNQCQANFSYLPSQNSQVQFLNLSVGSNPTSALSYSWNFGDGTYSTQQNPNHTFPADSTYWVCLEVYDATGCADTICQSIIVQDTTNGGCDAAFSYFDTGNLIVAFSSFSPSSNLSYVWDLGDGSSSTQTSPVHTYGAAGSYLVCLTVSDSTIGCDTTFCDSIYVSGTNSVCNADFTFISQGSNTFDFIDLSSNGTGITSWYWDFGDSTISTQQNPTHTFSNPGVNYVCLTISDSSGCTDTYCAYVVDSTSSGYMISGGVYADSQLVYNAIVYLIEHDTVAGTLTAIDSIYLAQSYYTFFNVAPGSYLVKAALLPSSPVYANHLPTYLGDALFWNNATSTVVTNNNVFNPPIDMVAGTNPGGPGFIGGLISQGANKNEGDPMANVSVILLDINDNPITHTITDENGQYSFGDIAYGTYKIMVEILGKYGNPIIVTISAENPSEENADFDVNINSVNPTTAINDFTFGELLSVYPNPAVDRVNIEMELYQPVDMEVRLVNLMGQAIQRKSIGRIAGNQLIQLETGQVPQGIYLIQIQAGDQQIVKRIVVGL